MSSKVIFVCLDERYCKALMKKVSSLLEMPLFDCDEYFRQRLADNTLFKDFTIEDINKIEDETLSLARENSLVKMDFDLYKRCDFLKEFKTFYVALSRDRLNEKEKLNILNFAQRDRQLSRDCNYTIKVENKDILSISSEILQILGEKI